MHYYTWSYVMSIGIGYLVNYVVSTKFAIIISLLSPYCVILNHLVTGSIMVMAMISKFSFCHFLLVTEGSIRYTQSLFRVISSASLSINLPYFILERFVRWKVSQLVISFWKEFLILGQYKCWQIMASVLSISR